MFCAVTIIATERKSRCSLPPVSGSDYIYSLFTPTATGLRLGCNLSHPSERNVPRPPITALARWALYTAPYNEVIVTLAARLIFGLGGIAFFSSGLNAESCGAFDVASIKVNTSGVGGGFPELAPGGKRVTATNQMMLMLIMAAYDVSPLQISGIPSALSQERYDIDAACDQQMTKEQLPRLFRGLLAERFRLSAHRETKEQPVYALVLRKGSPKLDKTSHPDEKPGFKQSGYSFTFTNADMSYLVFVLSQVTGRKVVDRTQLSGQYDFTLNYAPNRLAATDSSNVSPSIDGPPESVFTALREQLGLDLKSEKDQVEFIVVDHLDRPTPN